MAKNTFYSNGKLLITAEYLVLEGAEALAVPTVYGQDLNVKNTDREGLLWSSKNDKGAIWFEAVFQIIPKLSIKSTTDHKIAETLLDILQTAKKLNAGFLTDFSGFEVITHLNFPREWGLGTSSTLINNIAQWAKVDAFELLDKSFRGSGYDIACAQIDTPIVYSKSKHKSKSLQVNLKWPFTESLFFVYLNKKQDSKKAIAYYNALSQNKELTIKNVNELTKQFINCKSLSHFEEIIEAHEDLLSDILKTPKIKDSLFVDYSGSIKSLGAWGGDFVLVTRKDALAYFIERGYKTIIPFNEMVK